MTRTALFVTVLVLSAALLSAAPLGAADDAVTLTVSVTDDGGEAVRGATVTVSYDGDEQSRETLSSGRAAFDVPRGATVTVETEHDALVKNNPETVRNVDDHTEVGVTMYPAASVDVTVVDDEPIERATVTVRKVGQTKAAAAGTTGSDGVFSADGLERGDYTIRVVKSGYHEASTRVSATEEASAELAIEEGSATVDFTVVDENFEEARPIRAEITVANDGDRVATISTNDRGTAGVKLAVNTRYTVTIEKDGYDSLERSLSVRESDRAAVYGIDRTPRLSLEPMNDRVVVGQNVAVDVTDEYGEAVADATVLVDGEARTTTDEGGSAVIAIDSTGDVELTAERDGVTSSVAVVEGVSTDEDGETNADSGTGADADESDGGEGGERAIEDDGSPGFSAVVALAALSLASALITRRRFRGQ